MSRYHGAPSSVASSTGSNHGTVSADSTMTDFNPQKDGAIMSTQQFDTNYSQRLPELRTTAKKYGRWAPREHTDIIINTSAIGRAFPGFSQGGSSDDSISLEIGRRPKTYQRPSPTRAPHAEYSNNIESSQAATTGSVKVLGTPQRSQTKSAFIQDALRNNAAKKMNIPRRDTSSYKENIPPSETHKHSKASPYTSHASRTTSGERRTLAELHAQVADDTEGSIIGDERPTMIDFQPKNTRFSSVKSYTSNAANVSTHTSHAANVSTKRHEVEDALSKKLRTASGTPSKSQTKPHTNDTVNSNTRNPTQQSFLLPNMPDVTEATPTSFNKGTGVPLPGEEQDIYVNIDLLKDKVAELEEQLAQSHESQSLIQGERFKFQLERDRANTQLDQSLTKIEQLAKEIRQLRRDRSFTQDERSEMQLERDSAVTQLAESLKRNEQLENEILELKQQLSLYQLEHSRIQSERDQAQTHCAQSLGQNEQLQFDFKKLEIEYETFKKEVNQISVNIENNNTRSLEEKDQSIRRYEAAAAKVRELTLEISKTKQQPTKKQSFTKIEQSAQKDRTGQHVKKIDRFSEENEPSTIGSDGSDFASILGAGVMETLRREAKDSRAAKKSGNDETFHTIQSNGSSRATSFKEHTGAQNIDETRNQDNMTGRFSIKSAGISSNGGYQNRDDITGRFSINSAGRVEKEHTLRSTTSHHRHHSETSVHATRRRRTETDDMTSAFIIPDISSDPITTGAIHPSLSTSARQVLDSLCKHECTNCTICTRVASFDIKKSAKVVIPKPIPVSERMPEPTPYEEEPTIRPSVDPSLALATVIKGLEDEVAHLKMEHTRITAAHSKHDASLGMRQRKALKKRIEELLSEIDRKSDQLYGLYDVLEGQKQDADMTEELPWEGIDDTS